MGDYFVGVYIAFQIFVFIALALLFYVNKRVENTTLDNVQKAITAKRQSGEELTNYELNGIFKEQSPNSKYKKQWDRYYERISEKEADEKIKVEPYFGMESLHYAIGERQILEFGGGIHTSIGVLGTFLGLAFGLSGLNSLDPEALKVGIENLIGGMQIAFYTSILGVGLSLCWIIVERLFSTKLDEKIDWHANELSLLLNADDEEIFLNRLEKISANQAEQMTTLLTDALEKAFSPMMETMHTNNAQMASSFGQIESHLAAQNALTQEQLELTKNQNSEISGKLVDSITSDTREIIGEFVGLLTHSKVMQEHIVETVGQMTDRFEISTAQQEAMVAKTERMMEAYSHLSDGMARSQESYEKTSEELTSLSASLKEVQQLSSEQLPVQQQMLERSGQFIESSQHLVEQFSQFGQDMQQAQNTMVEELMARTETISTRFETLATELTKASMSYMEANKTNHTLISQTQQTIEQLGPVTEHMEGVAETLHSTMDQLDLLQERQAELIPHLQEWNEDVLTYLKDFVGLSETQMAEITSQVSYSKSQWESTAHHFDETRQQLATAMDSFSTGIEKGLTTTFQEFEKELTKVVQHFRTLSGTYLESQENLTVAMQETVESLAVVRGRS